MEIKAGLSKTVPDERNPVSYVAVPNYCKFKQNKRIMQGSVTVTGDDELKRKLAQAMQFIEHNLPDIIGIEGINHFKENFVQEGFVDQELEKWKPRKSKMASNRKTLTGESADHLSDSIDYKVNGNVITFYSDKPYAEIQNEGGTIAVNNNMRSFFWAMYYKANEAGQEDVAEQWKYMALSKTITIEKREFMGDSQQLNLKVESKIIRELDQIFKA